MDVKGYVKSNLLVMFYCEFNSDIYCYCLSKPVWRLSSVKQKSPAILFIIMKWRWYDYIYGTFISGLRLGIEYILSPSRGCNETMALHYFQCIKDAMQSQAECFCQHSLYCK